MIYLTKLAYFFWKQIMSTNNFRVLKLQHMSNLTITDNGFLRQFETTVDNQLCKIEYSAQERKIFLTKLIIPQEVNSKSFRDQFIVAVLDEIQERNLRVVPTCPEVALFLRKNRRYKEMLPVGIRI